MLQPYQPMVELTRGLIVESIHFGAVAVVDVNGRLVASYGEPETVTYLRSTTKPFQALPFIEREGDTHFKLTPREIAMICASHSGTDEHVATVRGMQEKIGVAESDLQCGVHYPYHAPTSEAMKARGEQPTPNRHNCSGKHTGMLAHAKMRQLSISDYLDTTHPVQESILQAFADMTDVPADKVELGTDGCSAPNFAVPLYNAALSFARLCDPVHLPTRRAAACRRITQSMMAHPDMVGGPGRFDTRLMEIGQGRIVAKGGAEGYQGIGLMPGALGTNSPALGIALKISDGDPNSRARPLAVLEVLRQLGALQESQLAELAAFGPQTLTNWRDIPVGVSRAAFKLKIA
jgi:L-asparaginase II